MTCTTYVAKCFFSFFTWRFQPQLEKMRAESAVGYIYRNLKKRERLERGLSELIGE